MYSEYTSEQRAPLWQEKVIHYMVVRMLMWILDKLAKLGKIAGLGAERWAALEPSDKFLLVLSLSMSIVGLLTFLLELS